MLRWILLVTIGLSSATALAEERVPRWWVQAEGGASYITDRSFDFIAATDPVGVGDIRFGFVPGWVNNHLELDLGYAGGTLGGESLQQYSTAYEIHSLQIGASYRQPLGNWFSAYGRIAGLLDFNGLHVSDISDNLRLSQWAVTGGLLFNVGGELTAYSWSSGRFGLLAEFGYAVRFNEAKFDNLSVSEKAKESIAPAPVNVGSLNVSGIQWRLGAVVHF